MKKYTLNGIDGNAYSVMGFVAKCMEKEGASKLDIDTYYKEATSGDYNNLLRVSQNEIDNLNKRIGDGNNE